MTTIKNSLFWKILVFIFITLVATMILGMIQQFSSISYTSITLPQFAPALARFYHSMDIQKFTLEVELQV